MRARKERGRTASAPPSRQANPDGVLDAIAGLMLEATRFISAARVQEMARGWLPGIDPGQDASDADLLRAAAGAIAMATDLAVFTPSASGATAFDRLARARGRLAPEEEAALAALRRSQFRLMRVEAAPRPGSSDAAAAARLRDLASGEVLEVLDEDIRAEAVGVALLGRLAPLRDGRQVFTGGVMPLDEAAFAVAQAFLRPGGRGLANPLRCAEAVCRHILRHGTLEVPGLNQPLEDGDDDSDGAPEVSELDRLAMHWAERRVERSADDVQFVRTQADLGTLVAMLASAANTREHGLGELSDAYAEIAFIQLETVHRRAAAGSGMVRLDMVAAAVDAAVAAGEIPPGARTLLRDLQLRLGAAPSGAVGGAARDAELDRLIARIQALRAKTVEQGCTEQEALAAAEKVAELLDRYGLSLSELDLSRQACEGAQVETERRRAGPVDDCVPAIAAFFDCRVWGEKSLAGTLHYVFFGLPADVVAARYLYDLVEQAFDTETARFRAGPTYAEMPTRIRRMATNSFQIGLARGIASKLQALRDARETALRGAPGRDLVVAKAGIIDAELAKLGLHLRARTRSSGRRVLKDAFDQGHEAGLGFEYTPGIAHGGT